MSNGSLAVGADPGGRVQVNPPAERGRISVCHIASGDRWAGAEAQMAFLLRGLAQRRELSLFAVLLNEGQLAEEIRRCGIPIHIASEKQRSFFGILAEAARFLRNKNIQILHSHRYKENLLAALLASRCGVPFVVRSQQGLGEPFKGIKRYKQAVLQQVDRFVASRATDRVIAASEDLRNVFSRYVPPKKVVAVHNALDITRTHSSLSSSQAKERIGIPADHLAVGIAGRLEPIKRVDIFLSAAAQIAAQVPRARFVVAGGGSQESSLRALATKIGMQDRILFLGHRNDIYDVIRGLDILVLCSDHEGLPTIVLEALYLGVPVVARSVGGVPEVVRHGINGVLVTSSEPSELANACVHLLNDGVYRRRLSSAGASWVADNFSSESTAAKVAEIYRSLCEAERDR